MPPRTSVLVRSRTKLDTGTGAKAAKKRAAGGGGAGGSKPGGAKKPRKGSLAFSMQLQKQTCWCWTAVATSVATFYVPAQKRWTQCKVAKAVLEPALGETLDCCGKDGPTKCDMNWYLEDALTRVGHCATWQNSVVTFAEIETEIGKKQPLGARVEWAPSEGHFVAITGYSDDGTHKLLEIRDPAYGPGNVSYPTYETFKMAYEGIGKWDATYRTKK